MLLPVTSIAYRKFDNSDVVLQVVGVKDDPARVEGPPRLGRLLLPGVLGRAAAPATDCCLGRGGWRLGLRGKDKN